MRSLFRARIRMRESPLEYAMDDQIGITANGRSEMSVLIEGERKMTQRLDGIARLLQRTQHQVREDSLLGLTGNFLSEALIVLWSNLKILRARKPDDHSALARAGVPPASPRRRNPPMANGDAFLGEPGDPQRITEGMRQLFKFEDLLGVGLFVN